MSSSISKPATDVFCRCCAGSLDLVLDLGPQPICSHFLAAATEQAARHPLALARCARCGQLQIRDPAPVSLLRSPHSWISYIEPEGHLDRLVDELCALPGAGPAWRVGGVTYKDASTLERLKKRGWTKLWQLDPATDLGITDGGADLALVQEQLTPARARQAAARHGQVDVLLVRHILEHTHRPGEFLTALKELVAPGGLMIFECPDAQRALLHREYTVLWEEHLWYFTPELFARFFGLFGMRLEALRVFPYSVENSLVALVRPDQSENASRAPGPVKLQAERAQLAGYGREFPRQKAAWQNWIRTTGGRIAAFGAGHSTCAFINFFELAPHIEFVADDHPKKLGLFLPGCGTPIRSSSLLQEDGVTQCLMGLSPESEVKVLARQEPAVKKGVKFVSIFPMSPRAADAVRIHPGSRPDVLRPDLELPRLGDADVETLRDTVRNSSRYRNRFCGHADSAEALHEMIICLHANTYVRPHRHHGRAESVHVIDGFADLVLFTDQGVVDRVVPLGPWGSGCTWYVRLSRPVFHTLVLRGEDFVFQETTLGPFRREDTEMAAWAPDDADATAVAAYKCELTSSVLSRASLVASLS